MQESSKLGFTTSENWLSAFIYQDWLVMQVLFLKDCKQSAEKCKNVFENEKIFSLLAMLQKILHCFNTTAICFCYMNATHSSAVGEVLTRLATKIVHMGIPT